MSAADVWFLLASGPSQCQSDIDAVRGHGTVLAINNQAFAAPWADVLFCCDAAWWEHYGKAENSPDTAALLATCTGRRVSTDPKAQAFGATYIPRETGDGMGERGLRTGCNSGYQVIQFAVMNGASTIVLLGYDMQHGLNGEHHNHPDHPRHMGNFNRGMPETCAPKFTLLAKQVAARGVRVINATRRTALTCFERMPLADVLAQLNPATAGQSAGLAPVLSPS